MAFNFGAFVGGLSESISEDIQEAQDRALKFDLMAEDEATRMRLASASERRTRKATQDKLTQGLAAYVGSDYAGAIVKQHGVAGAEQFLNAAQNYDGDFAAAVKLPELKNGVFGGDFANKPLMSLIPQAPDKVVDPKTHADWELRWLDEELTIAQMTDSEEKTKAKTAHQAKLENYYALIGDREKAKRKSDAGKGDPFYSNAERQKILKVQGDIAFSTLTGFAGARELSTQERTGSNIISVADYVAAINTYNQNEKGAKDENLTNDAIAAADVAKVTLQNFASQIRRDVKKKLQSGKPLSWEGREISPTALYDEDFFNSLAKQNALKIGGVYLVRTRDNKLKVRTYIGYNDVFSEQDKNYIGSGVLTGPEIANLRPTEFE